MVVGTVPVWEGRILLCKRAIEPRLGKWTLPGGFMENGESIEEAALRETREEACARVELEGLHAMVSLPFIHQVHFFYRARMVDGHFDAGEETLETALFGEDEIPWDELAFRTVEFALRRYFSDLRRGSFELHSTSLTPPPRIGG
jgi:ADP-ribose pyrophosphatase YjhB (NUDIX family)